MQKYAVYLARCDSRYGTLLAKNTVDSYFSNVRKWLMDLLKKQQKLVDGSVKKIGSQPSKHCRKRENECIMKKDPLCTSEDLIYLLGILHRTTTFHRDYQDVATLSLMWYVFGRSSDMAFLRKSNLSVALGRDMRFRLSRAKTCEEQGLSLYRGNLSFLARPIYNLACALMMQAGRVRCSATPRARWTRSTNLRPELLILLWPCCFSTAMT